MKKITEFIKEAWEQFLSLCKAPVFVYTFPALIFVGTIVKPCQLLGFLGLMIWTVVFIERTDEE